MLSNQQFAIAAIENAEILKDQIKEYLTNAGLEVNDHGQMIYATLKGEGDLLLQLNYWAQTNEVTCQMAGYGMNIQLFGTYIIASVDHLQFLLKSNSTINARFPALI